LDGFFNRLDKTLAHGEGVIQMRRLGLVWGMGAFHRRPGGSPGQMGLDRFSADLPVGQI
jgi:hypothetical protein